MSTILSRFADRLILCPSTDPIDVEDRRRVAIPGRDGEIECWVTKSGDAGVPSRRCVVIKFPGAAGRAERGRPYPFHLWDDCVAEVWTVNHRGYGGSAGEASVQNFVQTCDDVWEFIHQHHPDTPVVVTGNSLGGISALYLAGRYETAGILLRNPPPLAQMIAGRPRYNWWNFGLARIIARQVPPELDAIENAARADCPALFVRSERDRVIPQPFQQMIIDRYEGPLREFWISQARHHDPVGQDQEAEYLAAVEWLRCQVFG